MVIDNHTGQQDVRGRNLGTNLSRLWRFCVRHRATIRDIGLLGAALLVVAYLAFEIEIFLWEDTASAADERFYLNEVMLLSTVLTTGLFIVALRRSRDQKREIERRTAAEGKARELAYQDPLTGLANRRQFEEALRQAAASPPETGSSHAVLLLDLNGFKQVNDTYGHGIGDQVLIVIAQRLLGAVREGDLVARLGGDEFVVLSRHLLGPEAAANVALRIMKEMTGAIATSSSHHLVGAGIGIALMPNDATSAEEALRKADVALYRAKSERRSAFRFFETEMDALLQERERIERELKHAMDHGRIEPQFRPSFDLSTDAVVGFEAVPSWTNNQGETIPPERFLPIAEETGLIHDLASGVLEAACRAAATWPESITLSMDVLPSQVKDRSLAATILEILKKTGLDPRRLEIEIAESTLVHDLEGAKAALAPLRRAGVGIALDNFGTGYSNLYHMREFQIDKVKIARRLVENMGEEETARLVRALAGLGQGLGFAVCADGLKDGTQSGALVDAGVQDGQRGLQLVTSTEAGQLANRQPESRGPDGWSAKRTSALGTRMPATAA